MGHGGIVALVLAHPAQNRNLHVSGVLLIAHVQSVPAAVQQIGKRCPSSWGMANRGCWCQCSSHITRVSNFDLLTGITFVLMQTVPVVMQQMPIFVGHGKQGLHPTCNAP